MNILEKIRSGIVYFDGATGSMLQKAGLRAGEKPESWNLYHPEAVEKLHRKYYDAGCDIVVTNTFGANRLNFPDGGELEKIIYAAVENARRAAAAAGGGRFVALDIGPTGKLLAPLGDLAFEDAVSLFSEVCRIGAAAGADLIAIETMSDIYEAKAAVLAARESCSLPIFCTVVFDESQKMMTGADPECAAAVLEGLGCDAVGMNCSLGPQAMAEILPRLASALSVPLIVKPNAGMPRVENGETVYDVTPAEFAACMTEMVRKGAAIIGGCCGTTPEYISETVKATAGMKPVPLCNKNITSVASYTHAVCIGERSVIIGERINPTGKPKLKAALRENDMSYIVGEGIGQSDAGADILDVNCGLPEIDECSALAESVRALQKHLDTPLQLDTSDPAAMEKSLRLYNGKAMINSVNGKEESMAAVFPLAKKYGGVIVALTLDESGIPADSAGRLAIAEKILRRAEEYGIRRCDIVFDALAMAVSSDPFAARTTLDTVRLIRGKTGCRTILGVSNVSFGLPEREIITSVFYAMALEAGLDAAIMNPFSVQMMNTYHAATALFAKDEGFASYIENVQGTAANSTVSSAAHSGSVCPFDPGTLSYAIAKGVADKAREAAAKALKTASPLEVINSAIIPALKYAGDGFEAKTVFLPGLLAAAEAAKAAFTEIDLASPKREGTVKGECIIMATVKGDIHDIGKNIVVSLLENFGYNVIDLGRDVPPEEVVAAARRTGARFVGLSALMTTTVPAMEETVRLIHENLPGVKCAVGGAVLTKEYAEMIGADFYCGDAMDTVRLADRFFGKKSE